MNSNILYDGKKVKDIESDNESTESENYLSVQGEESFPNKPGRALLSKTNANSHQLQLNNTITSDKLGSSRPKTQQLQ
jgi:hypothetical protein